MHMTICRMMALWCAVTIAVAAQPTGMVKGRITGPDGKPVVGAAIRVLGTSPLRGALSKADGSYLIAGVRAGVYDLSVTLSGYRIARRTGVRVMIDGEVVVDFELAIDTTRIDVIIGDPHSRIGALPDIRNEMIDVEDLPRSATRHMGVLLRGAIGGGGGCLSGCLRSRGASLME